MNLHYALEAQRKHDRGDLYRAMEAAGSAKPFEFSDWVRICAYRYGNQPLNCYGSTIGTGGRFNFGDALDNVDAIPFPALYIGANRTVAYREYFGLPPNDKRALTATEFMLLPATNYSVVHVSGYVCNVLDITQKAKLQDFVEIIKRYSVSREVSELAETAGVASRTLVCSLDDLFDALYEERWRAWARQFGLPANCQIFGKLVWEAGYDALLYRSTKGGGKCLAVYPHNLQKSDTRIWLSGTSRAHTIATLDAGNWQFSIAPQDRPHSGSKGQAG